jgi:all-trans-retinol 13,14-reductase
MKYDTVIIGAGLSGLLCGYILAKEGQRVCVVEKNPVVGGCIQNFKREGVVFDCGAHYIGGLDDGESLFQYFNYFDLFRNINYKRLDVDGFDIFKIQNSEYRFAQGEENFINVLSKSFPKEKSAISKFTYEIKKIAQSFPLFVGGQFGENQDIFNFSKNIYQYLSELTENQQLRRVLTANNLLYLGKPTKTPMYLFSLINYGYIESAWRVENGSGRVADLLAESIRNFGGEILTSAEISKISIPENRAESIETIDGKNFTFANLISTIHPVLFSKIAETKLIRKAYYSRLNSLENTEGLFSVYIIFKTDVFPHYNSNFYCSTDDSSEINSETFGDYFFFFTSENPENPKYAKSAEILSPMNFSEVEKWEKSDILNRGCEYLEFKQKKAEALIQRTEKYFSGFSKTIHNFYTSSPLTYRDYTGTHRGSAYGIRKDINEPLGANILPITKIPNVFLSGQNINMHGVHGVVTGSVITCSHILGYEYLVNKIKNA